MDIERGRATGEAEGAGCGALLVEHVGLGLTPHGPIVRDMHIT